MAASASPSGPVWSDDGASAGSGSLLPGGSGADCECSARGNRRAMERAARRCCFKEITLLRLLNYDLVWNLVRELIGGFTGCFAAGGEHLGQPIAGVRELIGGDLLRASRRGD